MIFATIGNDHRQFKRFNKLVLKINELLPNEEIFYQNGYTPFISERPNIKCKKFINRKDFTKLLETSTLVFSHAGAGTLLQLSRLKKVPLVLPRLAKFKEHLDNHQKETLSEFIKLKFALEVDYPFEKLSLKQKIDLSQRLKRKINDQKNGIKTENSLKLSIKKDVKNYLKR